MPQDKDGGQRHRLESKMTDKANMWLDFPVRELTVNAVMSRQAAQRGDKIYVRTTDGTSLSFRDVHRETNRVANWLLAQGYGHGSHIAVFMENELECLFSHIAITKIGAVSVPINSSASGGMLAHYLNFSDAVAVIATPEFALRVNAITGDLEKVATLVVVGDRDGLADSSLRILDFGDTASAPSDDLPELARFSDLAFILFTSGTTGPSKGVMFPQARAFMWDEGIVPLFDIGEKDAYFACTPLSHATGLFSGAWMMMAVGGTLCLTKRFSASEFWDQIRATGATYTTLLGAMVSFIEQIEERPDDRDNPLRMLSAAPYPPTWESFEKRFGVSISIAYGLSDHSVPTRLPPGAPLEKRGSTGKVLDTFDMLIVDEDDIPVPAGVTGECLIRAHLPWRSSLGYYKQPEQTALSRRHEWFHTGDRGYLDADGYFWFVDRAKDTIRRLGENISSYEVEKFAGGHAAIAEIAVYPLAAEQSEEEVTASIVLRPGVDFHPRDLIRHCLETMPKYMVPRFVHIADHLPRNLNQRVEKYKLRAWAEAHRDELWDKESEDEFRRKARPQAASA